MITENWSSGKMTYFSIVAIIVGAALSQSQVEAQFKTTTCELVKHSERYRGKLVELRATVERGFERSLLVDNACSAEIWLEIPGMSREEYHRLIEYLGTHNKVATLRGRFDSVGWLASMFGHGFGHLSRWRYQVGVQSINDIDLTDR